MKNWGTSDGELAENGRRTDEELMNSRWRIFIQILDWGVPLRSVPDGFYMIHMRGETGKLLHLNSYTWPNYSTAEECRGSRLKEKIVGFFTSFLWITSLVPSTRPQTFSVLKLKKASSVFLCHMVHLSAFAFFYFFSLSDIQLLLLLWHQKIYALGASLTEESIHIQR